MKRDNKKALYESIMTSVAKEVKKALNEEDNFNSPYSLKQRQLYDKAHARFLHERAKIILDNCNNETLSAIVEILGLLQDTNDTDNIFLDSLHSILKYRDYKAILPLSQVLQRL